MEMRKAIVTEIHPNRNMDNKVKIDEFLGNRYKEAIDMDDNKIIEKYMDKIDQDRREQEQRLSNNIQSMENRLFEDRKLMEQRITEERRLSEERMEKRFNETMESIKNTNHKIDSLENKLDDKTDKMLEKVDSTNKWIMGTCIATILAVAAIAASVWFK
ncbi:hypothetical protein [Clostridium botulinum]|uniref:hypothetical protein n=1 Tax=Clostridium botulinum TaxID=1491 RepID=UPI000773037A|nr:hypothetical protein [Clostridium botulinum]MBY6931692.1 hypothetical protein [Clostridium botulinum]NFG20520.1 hypothetical protein [Clostridium botulinum]NFO80696.1 hypothetical protein [Clostridium botulinum]